MNTPPSQQSVPPRRAAGHRRMGEVWKATDELLGRPVAVKLLRSSSSPTRASATRFRAEARFAASLHHSGIAQVYDYGEQDDLIYLVMELVPGEPLSRILTVEGRLSPDTTLDMVGQAARALQVAHSAGIIHRDIKPGQPDGHRRRHRQDHRLRHRPRRRRSSTMTQTGQVMGTAQYVSPEQATGQAHHARLRPVLPRASWRYECLAGMPPFDADTPVALALMHVREDAAAAAAPTSRRPCAAWSRALHRQGPGRPPRRRAGGRRPGARAPASRVALGTETRPPRRDAATSRPCALDRRPTDSSPPIFPPPRRRLGGRGAGASTSSLVGLACAVVLVASAVFAAGALWRGPGHTKLVNGNRVDRAGRTGTSQDYIRGRASSPSDLP